MNQPKSRIQPSRLAIDMVKASKARLSPSPLNAWFRAIKDIIPRDACWDFSASLNKAVLSIFHGATYRRLKLELEEPRNRASKITLTGVFDQELGTHYQRIAQPKQLVAYIRLHWDDDTNWQRLDRNFSLTHAVKAHEIYSLVDEHAHNKSLKIDFVWGDMTRLELTSLGQDHYGIVTIMQTSSGKYFLKEAAAFAHPVEYGPTFQLTNLKPTPDYLPRIIRQAVDLAEIFKESTKHSNPAAFIEHRRNSQAVHATLKDTKPETPTTVGIIIS